jgi:hypothetical protein
MCEQPQSAAESPDEPEVAEQPAAPEKRRQRPRIRLTVHAAQGARILRSTEARRYPRR